MNTVRHNTQNLHPQVSQIELNDTHASNYVHFGKPMGPWFHSIGLLFT